MTGEGFRWPAVLALARAELRHGRRALTVLGLIAGLAGALVLGSVVVADRTTSAYSRLGAGVGLDDARAYLPADVPQVPTAFGTLPGVRKSWVAYAWFAELEGEQLRYVSVIAGPERPADLVAPLVVAGRAPRVESADELLVGEPLAARAGLQVGDQVTLRMLTLRQVARLATGVGEPDGATRTVRVVGIARMPQWGDALGDAMASPAFAAQNYGAAVGRSGFARLAYTGDPMADALVRARFADALAAAYAGLPRPQLVGSYLPEVPVFPSTEVDPAVAASGQVLTVGLAGFATVVGLTGLLVVGQGLQRHHHRGRPGQRVENALGLTVTERTTARVLAALPACLLAGLVVAAGGLGAGMLGPLGSQVRFEPVGGFLPNEPAVVLGGFGTAALLAAAVAGSAVVAGLDTPSRRVVPRAGRPFRWAARWPSVLVGLRMAARSRPVPGSGYGLPGAATTLGIAVAAAGIVASLVVGASLSRLVDMPARYGYTADLTIATAREPDMARLVADPRVAGLTVVQTARARVEGLAGWDGGNDHAAVQTDLYAFDERKGHVPASMVAGRLPVAADEAAVGPRLALREHLALGDPIRVTSPTGASAQLVVTGIVVPQPERGAPLGEGVVLTPGRLRDLAAGQPLASAHVLAVPGAAGAVYDDIARRLEVILPAPPSQVETLAGLLWLPETLAAVLAAFTIAGLVHTLVALARRHARDGAVLGVLGATPGQLRATFATMAAGTVLPGMLLGLLLGLGVGRIAWWQVASEAGVAADVAVPVAAVAAVLPAVVLVSFGLGGVAAARLARVPVAAALRAG